jgi:hypothetical protein
MKSFIAVVSCLALFIAPALAEEQISRELPLQFANAVEVAALFADKPLPKPPTGDFEGFMKRCLATAFADFPANAWSWQTYLETQSETRPTLDQPAAPTGKLLPEGMAEPPVAVTERNALRVKGTSAALAKLGEIIELLDRPVQQVGLQVEFLGLTREERDKLPGVTWTPITGEDAANKVSLISASGNFGQILTSLNPSSARMGTALCVRNGRSAELRVGEVLPSFLVLGKQTPSGQCRFLKLILSPRVNADNSVSLGIDGVFLASVTAEGDTAALAEGALPWPVQGQYRLAAGESILLALIAPWDKWPHQGPEHEQFGAQRLLRPVVAVTPRLLAPAEPYVPDPGPMDPDLNERFVGAIFDRAVKEGADGITLGMNDQGGAEVGYRIGNEPWACVMRLPSYVLRPLLHGLIDPAGDGNAYKRAAGGLELDITVERTTIQGRPGVVLTWPRP